MRTENHPIADIFPMMEGTELTTLTDDIKKNGLKEPIWLYEGKILDGRNRAKACETLGITPQIKIFTGTPEEAISHVWSMNRTRRHLNSGQAAVAASLRDKMLNEYAAVREAAKERQREHGNTAPGRPKEIQPKETPPDMFEEEKTETLTQIIAEVIAKPDERSERETRFIRAKDAGTNREYLNFTDKLVVERPDLASKIMTGEKTLPQVQREIKKEELQKNPPKPIIGKYRVIYADPPWNMSNQEWL